MTIKTITIGTCLQVKGTPCKTHPDGRVSIRIGDVVYTGKPVSKRK